MSTAGVVPQIRPLLEACPVHLAVSLHATEDSLRDQLVPLNRRFPIACLLDELKSLPQINRRHPVFFEYTLMKGVNDRAEDAKRLVRISQTLPSKVNLIPCNTHPGSSYGSPSPQDCDEFAKILSDARVRVTLRRPRGSDIAAACGQLALQTPAASQSESQAFSLRLSAG